ncbi:2-oxoglutarate (2OG) and Fe(II)-dependent oxygenase superfamily protein [Forsythia ovata]|uniref:2-oxoglutarate (2OG) and Fe(II)-dependent oxygenase superfamily protein n=1 Tax=Forsythia ovata TaxID=205694 RepID=A0ABD1SN59_9LAMI
MSQSDNLESYPPFFRPNHDIDSSENACKTSVNSDSDSDCLPVIDFLCMNPENLSQVCRDCGMFRLVNHGVPLNLLNQLQDHAKKLFSLTFEAKQDLFSSSSSSSCCSPIAYFWGTPALTPSGDALKKGSGTQDHNWLEGLNVSLTQVSQFQYEDPLLESFRSLLEEYGRQQCRVAKTLFSTMAHDLKLCSTKSQSYLSLPTGILRVYRYFRCMDSHKRWGIDVHTDSSVISILHHDEVQGLQVFKDNQWLDVKSIHNTLIVNVGDMAQAMSDDKYLSVKHRVKVNKEKERISIGYFVFPADDAVIECSKYKPFTYADFRTEVQKDLKTLGFKIGLPKFKSTQENT